MTEDFILLFQRLNYEQKEETFEYELKAYSYGDAEQRAKVLAKSYEWDLLKVSYKNS